MNRDFKRPFWPTINLSLSRRVSQLQSIVRVFGENCGFAGIVRAMHRSGALDFFTVWALARAQAERHRRLLRRSRRSVPALMLCTMYSEIGRPSIPPGRLLKASLLIALYSVRSDRESGQAHGLRRDFPCQALWMLRSRPSRRPWRPAARSMDCMTLNNVPSYDLKALGWLGCALAGCIPCGIESRP